MVGKFGGFLRKFNLKYFREIAVRIAIAGGSTPRLVTAKSSFTVDARAIQIISKLTKVIRRKSLE